MTSTIRRLVIVGGIGAALSGLVAGSAQAAPPPPQPTTLPATAVGTTTAVLNGYVDTHGAAVAWEFQYGRSIDYGQNTPVGTIPPGHGTVSVAAKVRRLRPGTKYHFTLDTETGVGTAYYPLDIYYAQDLTFTTKRLGRLNITSAKLKVSKGKASIPVKCASTQTCKGKLTLTVQSGRHTLTLAGKSFTIGAEKKATLKPKLTQTALTLLVNAPRSRLGIRVNGKLSTGQPNFSKRVTLVLG